MRKISKEMAEELISKNAKQPTEKQKNTFNSKKNIFLNAKNGSVSASYYEKGNTYILIKEPKSKTVGSTTYIYMFYAECCSVEKHTYNKYGCFYESIIYYKY